MFRYWTIETGLLLYLFGIAAWMMWQTGGAAVDVDKAWTWLSSVREWEDWGSTVFSLTLIAIFALPVVLYWTLQFRGSRRVSFWLVAVLSLGPQLPAVLAYNRVDWLSFWKYPMFTTDIPQPIVGLLLLVSLLALATLQRTSDLRGLSTRHHKLGLDSEDHALLVKSEALVLAAIVGAALGITGILMAMGMMLSGLGGSLETFPWMVVCVGALTLMLLAAIIALWVRGLNSSQSTQKKNIDWG